ncbi:PhnA domain-containing protein [Celerinatantimonas yamalensis]|uniref:PhnA domain-containing protein n=1 Tax=Celerinatantimonas yamalensis TaxID=559956 RepID=A0ABW9G4K1_9GAMM
MSIEQILNQRAEHQCELCKSSHNLEVFEIANSPANDADHSALLCETCRTQLNDPTQIETNHWRCLSDSMWSPIGAIQVLAYRQLHQLKHETWAQDLLDMLYLDDELRAWADTDLQLDADEQLSPTLDSNGTPLEAGDTVHLIKDLVVKGAGFTAKRGTAVRNISLTENPTQIEGRVNGTRIVLLTQYLKKSS